jgi:hypothetical protein
MQMTKSFSICSQRQKSFQVDAEWMARQIGSGGAIDYR